MKAIVYSQYGEPEVLQLQEVTKPVPRNNEILIKIKATAVNSADWRLRRADPFAIRLLGGLTKPKLNILGGVFSGEVESTGKDVTGFKIGDKVFGSTDMRFGAYAEYKCIPENGTVALKPENLTFEEAAVIPFGATTALHFLNKANITPGKKVLIVGASGAVGIAAIQLAKHYGAQVTGVCSTTNINLAKSIGADKAIDYTKEDFTKSGETYDVIFDTVNTISVLGSLKALNKNGLLILSAAGLAEMLKGAWINMTTGYKVLTGVIRQTQEDIKTLKQLAEAGELKPVIDKTYNLAQMVAAHTYAQGGHKKGNVAITV